MSLGERFRVTLFGESHGKCVGALVDGCPPGVIVDEDQIRRDLRRRMPVGIPTTSRRELDEFEILSGVFEGRTTGAPITVVIYNKDVDSSVYEITKDIPRPSHADYVAKVKYFGYNDYRGGGIFSGRLTAALVAAGSLAKTFLRDFGIKIRAHIVQVGRVRAELPGLSVDEIEKAVDGKSLECADDKTAIKMLREIEEVRKRGDSVGGVIECVIEGAPIGLGEPPINTLDGDLAKAMFVIPAVKGIEFGTGFKLAEMTGSDANDQYRVVDGRVVTVSNNSGGILGGMSNGMPIRFRVVIKPTPSILRAQKSVNLKDMGEVTLALKGRFDPCVAVRAPPIVESAAAIVIADHLMRWLGWIGSKNSGNR